VIKDMLRNLYICTVLLCLLCPERLGQSTFRVLTPGKSTRLEVERELGRHVKSLSPTLFEYKEPEDLGRPMGIGKIYVQYRDGSAGAIVERIELVCDYPGRREGQPDGCSNLFSRILQGPGSSAKARTYASLKERQDLNVIKRTIHYGPPWLLVHTWSSESGQNTALSRLGFYSAELFEASVPRNCTGTFLGEWDTNRGRLILTDIPGTFGDDPAIDDTRGTYSTNNGTVTGHAGPTNRLSGVWKDATGTGTFELKIDHGDPFVASWPDPRLAFTGSWVRKTGTGPKSGTWEGRCVQAASTSLFSRPDDRGKLTGHLAIAAAS
jgi:hypothetical protein